MFICCRQTFPLRSATILARFPQFRRHSTSAGFSSFFYHNRQWDSNERRGAVAPRPEWKESHLTVEQASMPPTIAEYHEAETFNLRQLIKVYQQLSKARLTVLNVLAAMSGVAISPIPTTINVLLATAIGTALCSASANTLNQIQEVPFDAQMARTRMRPLVRRAITPTHATAFAVVTGIAGPAVLYLCSSMAAFLGAGNILLYAGLYTWMKRQSVVNTWVGAVVGAIPPLIGWTACGGQLYPSGSLNAIKSCLTDFEVVATVSSLNASDTFLAPLGLFALLFSWQFPHFNTLSHVVRGSYAQAGYKMLSVVNPRENALVSLRHAALLFPICSVLIPVSGLTTWTFALTSLAPNTIFAGAAWQFWRKGGEKEARVAFKHSLWYLPAVLGLMMLHKKGTDWLEWIGLRENTMVEDVVQ